MTCTIHQIYRYPVKGGSSDALQQTLVTEAGIPNDRKWALVSPEHNADPNGAWMPYTTFECFKNRPSMATWQTRLTTSSVKLIINGETFHLQEGDTATIDERQVRLVKAQKGYWDDKDAVISIINLATIKAISDAIDVYLDPIRFRANIYIEAEPWSEFDWLGQIIQFNDVRLQIIMPTGRCKATSIAPESGEMDHNIPALLAKYFGHTYCGMYAKVLDAGEIAVGNKGHLMQPDTVEPNTVDFDTIKPDSITSDTVKPNTIELKPIESVTVEPAVKDRTAKIKAGFDFIDTSPIRKEHIKSTASDLVQWPRPAKVVRVIKEATGIHSIWLQDSLADINSWQDFKPGQHIRLYHLDNIGTWRSYTVSAYKDGLCRITVKRSSGKGSQQIHRLVAGDTVIFSGPTGDMTIPFDAKAVHIITSGIGITPATAMLADLADFTGPIHFVHTTRANELALWHEIEAFADMRPNVSTDLFISNGEAFCLSPSAIPAKNRHVGRPNMTQLALNVAEANAHVIVCGSSGFSNAILSALDNQQVPVSRIGYESFASVSIDTQLREPADSGPYPVRFDNADIDTVWQKEAGTLLDLAEDKGLTPTANCRAGICRKCSVELIAGEVEQLAGIPLSKRSNQVLLCCSVPTSAITVAL